jgi:phage terminase Nu1 subunit (DNA packaging protein)
MDLRRRAVEVDEKKLAAALERAAKAAAEAAALEQKVAGGGQVTAEDVRRIRELYGLRGEGGAA